MEVLSRSEPKANVPFHHDPNYLTLSRMLVRYQNLILLTPIPDEKLETRLAPLQKKVQAELWEPLPFHRTQWLRSIEGARTLLLKLEQSAQNIKVQRTRRDAVKDLAEKRMAIKRLRARVEEIGREVESAGTSNYRPRNALERDDQSESMLDVLQQIRRSRGQPPDEDRDDKADTQPSQDTRSEERAESDVRNELFDAQSNLRKRQGKSADGEGALKGSTSGFSNLNKTEDTLLASSREHEDITTSLVNMAAQLKQQARAFQFTLDQDKGLIDRALEGLDQNVSALGVASKGMKTLQRMSEEQGFWGRLKLQAIIAGMWAVAFLLVFVGPKLRF